MAASSLIHECATLDSSVQNEERYIGPDTMLDSSKQLYAARLAVCELNDARVHVPEACRSFLPSPKSVRRRVFKWRMNGDDDAASRETYPQYEELTSQDLNSCLSALHRDGSGQGWTSFSNNKKHAVAMCHAVRGDIEKDSHINLFKVLANSTVGITEALSRSTSEWTELVAEFELLKTSMQQFHFDLHRDNIGRQDEVLKLWLKMKRAIQQDLTEVSQTVHEVRSQVLRAGEELANHERSVERAFNQTTDHVDSLATYNTNILSAAAEQGTLLREAMLWLQELMQNGIAKVVRNTTQNVEHAALVTKANIQITEQLYAQSERAARLVASIEAASVRIQQINNLTVKQAEQANISIMNMTTAMSRVTNLLQSVYDGLMPHFHNTFWTVLYFLFALSCWRSKVKDTMSVVPLSMGTALVLAYIVRLQDTLAIITPDMIPASLMVVAVPGGLGMILVARWLLQRQGQRGANVFPTSSDLLVTERHRQFHHHINDPRYFNKMLSR